MKNGTRKTTNNAIASPESPDLRAEIAKRAYEIWLNDGSGHG